MDKDIVLYPSCSTWVGRLIGKEYETTIHDKGTPNEWEETEEEYNICTESNPNDGLIQALNAVRDGHTINDIEWDNSGGGANGEYLDNLFKIATEMVKVEKEIDTEFEQEEVDLIDTMIWGASEDGKEVALFLERTKPEVITKLIPTLIKMISPKILNKLFASDKIPREIKDKILVEMI